MGDALRLAGDAPVKIGHFAADNTALQLKEQFLPLPYIKDCAKC
jgi:hypothetical protein